MLEYQMIKNENGIVSYSYYPEGKRNNSGVISFNRNNGSAFVEKQSENDFGKRYAFKLIDRIKDFETNNSFQEQGIIAWY